MALNLEELRLSSQDPLRAATRRQCPGCSKSRSLFCPDCCLNLCEPTPALRLPVKVRGDSTRLLAGAGPCRAGECLPSHTLPPTLFILSPRSTQVDIVQHGETNAMGTGAHAALLAPEDVRLWRHAGSSTSRRREALSLELPEYDPASTVVLFPESKVGDAPLSVYALLRCAMLLRLC